jgi:nucleoside phosphorylase
MNVDFRFPDYAWLAESTEFGQFLDIAFEDDHGEVWLFNNDLEMMRQTDPFRTLYVDKVAGTLRKHITAVRVLIRPDLLGPSADIEMYLKKNKKLCEHLCEIARLPGGKNRLSTFYFGVASNDMMPKTAQERISPEDTWVFYAQRAELDSGIVMLRHRYFPFHVHGEKRHHAIVWMLQHYPALRDRLKDVFPTCFKSDENFKRLVVTSTNPFEFTLADVSADTRKGRSASRTSAGAAPSLSLGDHADVAIIAALPEEMAEFKRAIPNAKVRKIPLHDDYEYFVLQARSGPKKVLLTTVVDQGSIPAAVRTWDMIQRWRPNHIVLIGVAGGDPEDPQQKLGDVVVGNWIVGYERGKISNGVFKRDNSQYTADDTLLPVATKVKNGGTWPRHIGIQKPDGANTPCDVHDDLAIGSGSKLVADAAFFNYVREANRKVRALEMEADGVGCACDKWKVTKVKTLVIKGIMDKCNEETRNMDPALRHKWMLYAARASSEFAMEVLRSL